MHRRRSPKSSMPCFKALCLFSPLGQLEFEEGWAKLVSAVESLSIGSLEKTQDFGEADFIFLATGGTEHQLLNTLAKGATKAVLAFPKTNAFAALQEVRASYEREGKALLCAHDFGMSTQVFFQTLHARAALKHARIASIGPIPDWLVASIPSVERIENIFGMQIHKMEWDALSWEEHPIDPNVQEGWDKYPQSKQVQPNRYKQCLRLSSSLLHLAKEEKYDAILTGCFPLLSQHCSACLGLSDLLDQGIIAVCENDYCAAMMMLMADYSGMCDSPPWMANLVDIQENTIELHHCTVAKQGTANGCVVTHFESQDAAAFGGIISHNGPFSIMRLNQELDTLYISDATLEHSFLNSDGCRHAAVFKLPQPLLKPLGNHHVVVHNNNAQSLKALAKLLQMQIVEQ